MQSVDQVENSKYHAIGPQLWRLSDVIIQYGCEICDISPVGLLILSEVRDEILRDRSTDQRVLWLKLRGFKGVGLWTSS